jgi:putative mRNA 3-end processing factor
LNRAIEATGAQRVFVTHGHTTPLVQWLNERGIEAHTMKTEFDGEAGAEEAGA